MDAYTLHLLGLAVEACGEEGFLFYRGVRGWRFSTWTEGGGHKKTEGPTLAEALAALLTDLGVETPEPPEATA